MSLVLVTIIILELRVARVEMLGCSEMVAKEAKGGRGTHPAQVVPEDAGGCLEETAVKVAKAVMPAVPMGRAALAGNRLGLLS